MPNLRYILPSEYPMTRKYLYDAEFHALVEQVRMWKMRADSAEFDGDYLYVTPLEYTEIRKLLDESERTEFLAIGLRSEESERRAMALRNALGTVGVVVKVDAERAAEQREKLAQ